MLKEPNPGEVKTRLGKDIGMRKAAWWFRDNALNLIKNLSTNQWWSKKFQLFISICLIIASLVILFKFNINRKIISYILLFSLFGGFAVDDDVYDDVWRMYNRDPWNRRFPKFVDGSVEDMYINSSYENRVSYGFWVYYRDRVITSNSDIRDDTNYGVRYISEVPVLILHTTTIEGVTVACLDVVNANKI